MSAKQRRWLVRRLLRLSDHADGRIAVAAARALISADLANLKQAELWASINGPGERDIVDHAVIIDADPEIVRLEAELLARRAAISAGDSGRVRLGDDVGAGAMAEPSASDAVECGTRDSGVNSR